MASIDKIYGTQLEAKLLRRWIKRHRPKALGWVYQMADFSAAPPEAERPIAQFKVGHDKWLARKCPLPFVLQRIAYQYKSSKTGEIAKARLRAMGIIPNEDWLA